MYVRVWEQVSVKLRLEIEGRIMETDSLHHDKLPCCKQTCSAPINERRCLRSLHPLHLPQRDGAPLEVSLVPRGEQQWAWPQSEWCRLPMQAAT